jgi:hypothetical protein
VSDLVRLALVARRPASADFRLALTFRVSANKVCFERELLGHYRLASDYRE